MFCWNFLSATAKLTSFAKKVIISKFDTSTISLKQDLNYCNLLIKYEILGIYIQYTSKQILGKSIRIDVLFFIFSIDKLLH